LYHIRKISSFKGFVVRAETSYLSLLSSFRQEVKHDKISASYKNGVLRIVLPKSEEAKKKEVKIKVE